MARDYNDAVETLNTLQSNFAILKAIRDSGRYGANAQAIPEMIEWCKRLGYEPSDFNRLNVIHIAGTKGKGSTSAFISSILSQHARSHSRPLKIGLYTSPHLRTVRERIQINSTPLSPSLFARYFFETWDRISQSTHVSLLLPSPSEHAHPNYFRFLTLTALHTFLREDVDVAILECGMGGEFDSTNIVPAPAVTAVTSLGMDHLDQLGKTMESIAWHKSGVFKSASPGPDVFVAARQPEGAHAVLAERAGEKGKRMVDVDVHPQIASGEVDVGLEGTFQKLNASVGCAVAAAYLRQGKFVAQGEDVVLPRPGSVDPLPATFKKGLADVRWKGRCETRQDRTGDLTWYIDGGHTLESVLPIAEWFAGHVTQDHEDTAPRILLFNQQTRDATVLLRALYEGLAKLLNRPPFTHAIFSTNTPYNVDSDRVRGDASLMNKTADVDSVEKLVVQNGLADAMRDLDAECSSSVVASLEEAVKVVRSVSEKQKKAAVLATGSLHLVGGVIEVLEGEEE